MHYSILAIVTGEMDELCILSTDCVVIYAFPTFLRYFLHSIFPLCFPTGVPEIDGYRGNSVKFEEPSSMVFRGVLIYDASNQTNKYLIILVF